jgi:hypothetical protein
MGWQDLSEHVPLALLQALVRLVRGVPRTNTMLLREHRILTKPTIVLHDKQQALGFTSWADWLGASMAGPKPHPASSRARDA